MIEPEDIELEIAQDDSEMEYPDEASNNIAMDKWGNAWDTSGEFTSMDFRLVDDEKS